MVRAIDKADAMLKLSSAREPFTILFFTTQYDTMKEFNVDSKAKYSD